MLAAINRLISRRRRAALVVIVLGATTPAADSGAEDVHDLFEKRCGRCHAHAGDLARQIKFDPNGRLVGSNSGQDIRAFLDRHHAGEASVADALYALFARQAARGGEFRNRCTICHGRARQLVQERLVIKDGRLVGRYNGREVADFLVGHARLGATESGFFSDVLREIAEGR